MALMQVSRKIDYVLRAVIYLARWEGDRVYSIAEIAKAEDIPKKFLEKILQDLTHKGIVHSRRGAQGGYSLARPRDQITFREIIEAVEGPVSMNTCLGDHIDCSIYEKCGMLWVWREAQRRVIDLFSKTTLADIPVPRGPIPPMTATVASNTGAPAHV